MSEANVHTGRCFCGAVELTVTGEPVAMGYCHCESCRQWCKTCGGHVMTEHPLWSLTDVYVAVVPDLPFKPALHVNYQETVLPMKDGLPKQKDVPAEMGGSGTVLAD